MGNAHERLIKETERDWAFEHMYEPMEDEKYILEQGMSSAERVHLVQKYRLNESIFSSSEYISYETGFETGCLGTDIINFEPEEVSNAFFQLGRREGKLSKKNKKCVLNELGEFQYYIPESPFVKLYSELKKVNLLPKKSVRLLKK